MKLRASIPLTLLMAGLIIVGVSACNRVPPYRKYVSKKLPVYPAKVDTVIVQPGVNKILFKVPKPNDPIVTKLAIFWRSGTDSLIADYPLNEDTLSVGIDTINGGRNYSFNFYNLDKKGDRSLRTNRLVFIPEHPPQPVILIKSLWSNAKLPTDTWSHYKHYAFNQLWDNNSTVHGNSFETGDFDTFPMWFTINLGQKAKITSFIYFPQPHWQGCWPKVFKVYGSPKPKVDSKDPFNDSWILLGTYEPVKTGDTLYVNPDIPYPDNGVNLTVKNARNNPYVQYIRIKSLSSMNSSTFLCFGEFTFYGVRKNRK